MHIFKIFYEKRFLRIFFKERFKILVSKAHFANGSINSQLLDFAESNNPKRPLWMFLKMIKDQFSYFLSFIYISFFSTTVIKSITYKYILDTIIRHLFYICRKSNEAIFINFCIRKSY